MKSKMFLAAALVIVSSVSSIASTGNKQVPNEVIKAFNADFAAAGKVTWESATGYYKAGFIESGLVCYAFYTATGELMGMGRQLTTDMIPVALAKQMQSKYSGYTLTELYEIGSDRTGDYLMLLSKGKEQIRLRSNESGEWNVVKN